MATHAHVSRKPGKHPALDSLVALMAIAGPLLGLPQAIQIFVERDATGLSIWAWLGFTAYTLVFLTYGIVYRLRPVIVTQILWLCLYLAVISGIVVYG